MKTDKERYKEAEKIAEAYSKINFVDVFSQQPLSTEELVKQAFITGYSGGYVEGRMVGLEIAEEIVKEHIV